MSQFYVWVDFNDGKGRHYLTGKSTRVSPAVVKEEVVLGVRLRTIEPPSDAKRYVYPGRAMSYFRRALWPDVDHLKMGWHRAPQAAQGEAK